MSPDDPRHGTNAGHVAGCRVWDCCGVAKLRYDKRRKFERSRGMVRRMPVHCYRRRVEALACLGWSFDDLAAELGVSHSSFSMPMYRGRWISIEKYRAISDVYERLCMTQRTGANRSYTLNLAERRGYVPPLAWDDIDVDDEPWRSDGEEVLDEVAIERALGGVDSLSLARPERVEALKRHLAAGGTKSSFERVTGIMARRYLDDEAVPA